MIAAYVWAVLQAIEPVGFDPARLELLTRELAAAVERGDVPGAVCIVGRGDRVAYRRAFGWRALEPAREPMTVDTIFDVASLTKPLVTATCVLSLVEDGTLRLGDRLTKWLPGFAAGGGGRERVTIEQALLHRAGFAADDPLELYTGAPEEIFSRKHRLPLPRPPGEAFVYSDVGYEELGRLLEVASKKRLDVLAQERVFGPFDMREAHFRPSGEAPPVAVERVAPTERQGDGFLRGVVHDPRARALGGVAGHAGLFATADDVAAYARALLAGRGLTGAAVRRMTAPRFQGDADLRALGWDVHTTYSSPRGELFPRGSFGHTGFTGSSLWIDPASRTFVILLTNALHGGTRGALTSLRVRVGTLAAAAVEPWDPSAWEELDGRTGALLALAGQNAASRPAGDASRSAGVRPGVEVLRRGGFEAIAGKTVGLVTNPTGRDPSGVSTIDVLTSEEARRAGVRLVSLFSPEHGIRGDRDEPVESSTDPKSGLPVHSLYGETRRPQARTLKGLDCLVIDLADVGCRFYTYLATVGYCLEACAAAGIDVVLLDRPNPIGADRFEGALLDADVSTFTGYHAIPVRTGLTIGEAARLFNAERKIGAKLTVVPMQHYTRDLWYDETGLPWVNPSPNLRSVTQAALYPALCLLEFTNVSVGRGTECPFEWFGAPWLDGRDAAEALARRAVAGVRFTPLTLTPASSTHAGIACGGVRITITDRSQYSSTRLGFEIATFLRDRAGGAWDAARFPELLRNRALLEAFAAGAAAGELVGLCQAAYPAYAERRARVLLYPDAERK